MFTNTHETRDAGHAHGVDLDESFDFLNTLDTDNGFPVEKLPTLDDALRWFVDRGVIHREGADRARAKVATHAAAAAKDLEHVHQVRGALRDVATAIAENRSPRASALNTVNRALHARQVIELVAGPDGCSVDHRHIGDPIDDALARLAEPLVSELTGGRPERIRVCASTGRRRWCDMATCGNRAKAARHRARTRAEANDGDPSDEGGPVATTRVEAAEATRAN